MRGLVRRLVLWAMPELALRTAPDRSVVYVIGDPFDTETNPRRRQANAKRIVQGDN